MGHRIVPGKIGRLGIDMKRKVETWEYQIKRFDIVKGNLVIKVDMRHSDNYHEGVFLHVEQGST